MLDFDLAELCEVETRVLNQAVKRNLVRFPDDFMFQLTKEEWSNLKSQIVISNEKPSNSSQIVMSSRKHRGKSYLPYAFTEHGVAMLASVLRSPKAIEVNISIVRAFIALRRFALNYKELAQKIAELEKKYDHQFEYVFNALKLLLSERKKKIEQRERKQIGYKNE